VCIDQPHWSPVVSVQYDCQKKSYAAESVQARTDAMATVFNSVAEGRCNEGFIHCNAQIRHSRALISGVALMA